MINYSTTNEARIYNGEKKVSSTSGVLRKLTSYMEKNESRTLPHTIYKNKFKIH